MTLSIRQSGQSRDGQKNSLPGAEDRRRTETYLPPNRFRLTVSMTDRDRARALSDGVALPLSPFSPGFFLRQNYDEEKHLLSSAKRKEARKEG